MRVDYTSVRFLLLNRRNPALGTALAAVLMATGCTAKVTDNRDSAQSATPFGATAEKVLIQKDDADNVVSEVTIPPGSLATGQTVSVSSSFVTDSGDIAAEFGISSTVEIKPTNVATVVSSNMDANLSSPMTIALELPSTALGLTVGDINYMVVYTVRDAEAKAWKRGIIPDESLTLADGKITFTSKLFGRFELFTTSAKVAAPEKPRLVATPDFNNPPMSLTAIKPLLAGKGETVTLRGKYLTAKAKVSVGGLQAEIIPDSPEGVLRFKMPELPFGLKTVTVADAGSKATAQVVSRSLKLDYPISSLSPEKVCQGITYYDISGVLQLGRRVCDLKPCQDDGQVNCVATDSHPAVTRGAVPYERILVGTKFLGEEGKFPVCSSNGQQKCAVGAEFEAVPKELLTKSNILNGVTIGSTTGEAGKVDPKDLRAGVTVAGVTGRLKTSCRNGANLKVYNYKYNHGSIGFDIFDRITDNAQPDNYGDNSDDFRCDANNWTDVTAKVIPAEADGCQGNATGKECVFRDDFSRVRWHFTTAGPNYNFDDAFIFCKGLKHAGGNWRLPSQKELMQAYINGVSTLTAKYPKLIYANDTYWSDTTFLYPPQNKLGHYRMSVVLAHGAQGGYHNTVGARVVCVQD